MKCLICNKNKLIKEYPFDTVHRNCDHPVQCCYVCSIEHLREKKSCPNSGCKINVNDTASIAKQYQEELRELYPPIEMDDNSVAENTSEGNVKIVTLTGDVVEIPYKSAMTVEGLTVLIKQKLGVEPKRQLLVFKGHQLERGRRLSDCGVKSSSSIHLMILLYEIPDHCNHVIFDLQWGYPPRGRDYLDASCLIYQDKAFKAVLDYNHRSFSDNSIWHSGDVMDDTNRIGHHTIEAKLKEIPKEINFLYFTLSSWDSPTIKHYPNPTLKFFDVSDKAKNLCGVSLKDACDHQAVVMVTVWRSSAVSLWQIIDHEGRMVSKGNARNYEPLKETIMKHITQIFS